MSAQQPQPQPHQSAESETPRKKNILIIGGGISGLSMAHRFIHDRRWGGTRIHITLMERKDRYGGRVKTMRLSNDATHPNRPEWYEAGASRVAQSHHRVRQLARSLCCKEMGLPASYDRRTDLKDLHRTFRTIYEQFVTEHSEKGLFCVSWDDVMKMVCSRAQYTTLKTKWGFQSVLIEMNAYDFWHYAMPQYLSETYYTYENGLQSIIDRLVAELESSALVTLCTHTKVLNIQSIPATLTKETSSNVCQVNVSYQNDDHANVYTPTNTDIRQQTFDLVCCALPAEAMEEVRGVPQYYAHLWSAVSRNHLIRCYVNYRAHRRKALANALPNTTHPTRKTRRASHAARTAAPLSVKHTNCTTHAARTAAPLSVKHTNCTTHAARTAAQLSAKHTSASVLHKCTTTHSPHWFQMAYCDHTHADHLYNTLRLPNGVAHFRATVSKTVGPQWGCFDDADLDVHYWKSGTHSWKPQLLADNHYARALQLDAKLPLFVVGSSLSHYQHWMEGALETVHDAYAKMWRFAVEWWDCGKKTRARHGSLVLKPKQTPAAHTRGAFVPPFYLHTKCSSTTTFTLEQVASHQYVVLDGYVYDIRPIADQHPGGRKLLENVLGTDISQSYHRIGHSGTARAWVEQHCKGVLRKTETPTPD